MSVLGRELLATLVAELRDDPALAHELATLVAPHLPDPAGGWLGAQAAADYLGLGSLDALDRLVRDGLGCRQPGGAGGKRFFRRRDLDGFIEGRTP